MPTVSLIIPSRDRAHTLRYAIRSAIADPSRDYEVLVSDNASIDDTQAVVSSFDDSRLRYINPGRRLPMADHWEFAVQNSRGDYVVIIGDDDAVNGLGISTLLRQIDASRAAAIHWQTHVYLWPAGGMPARAAYIAPAVARPERITIRPLVEKAYRWGIINYAKLPHLYHSAISRNDVLDKIRLHQGTYFKTTQPDVWMSFAIPAFIDCVDVITPITTNGHSSSSNGGALFSTSNMAELNKFHLETANDPLHSRLSREIDVRVTRILEPMILAKESFSGYYDGINLNISAMWAFAESVLGPRTGFNVSEKLRAISKDREFSFIKYLLYRAVFAAQKGRTASHAKRSTYSATVPDDICQFVMGLDERV